MSHLNRTPTPLAVVGAAGLRSTVLATTLLVLSQLYYHQVNFAMVACWFVMFGLIGAWITYLIYFNEPFNVGVSGRLRWWCGLTVAGVVVGLLVVVVGAADRLGFVWMFGFVTGFNVGYHQAASLVYRSRRRARPQVMPVEPQYRYKK